MSIDAALAVKVQAENNSLEASAALINELADLGYLTILHLGTACRQAQQPALERDRQKLNKSRRKRKDK